MRLRKLEEKDTAGMLEWMHEEETQKIFRRNMLEKTKEEVLEFINNAEIYPTEKKSIHYAIVNSADEYEGTVSLKNIDRENKNAEYAISMRKEARGTGSAYEATEEILKIAFEEIRLERVYLNVLEKNKRAIYFYEKYGWKFEGKFKKHLYIEGDYCDLRWYAILKEEYLQTHKGEEE